MKKLLLVLVFLVGVSFLTGCGSGGSGGSGGGGGSTPAYTLYYHQIYYDHSGAARYDTSAQSVHYTYGSFTNNTSNPLQTYSGAPVYGASGSNGNFYLSTTNLPTGSSPLPIQWENSFVGDQICPSNLNGNAGFTQVPYTAPNQYVTSQCRAAFPYFITPGTVDPLNTPPSLAVSLDNPVDTTYGSPLIYFYDSAGNFLASEGSAGMTSDGLTVYTYTDLLGNLGYGDILVVVMSMNADGTSTAQGGGVVTLLAPPPGPGDGGGGGGGCYSNNCILEDDPN